MKKICFLFLICLIALETSANQIKPPQAEKIPHKLEKHGDIRIDNYFWMKDIKNPKVISHLKAENKYADQFLNKLKNTQDELYKEMRARIKEDDSTAPYKWKNYYYYYRTEKNAEYPIYARKYQSENAKEEILLDVPKMAKGFKYYNPRNVRVSPNEKILAYAVDTKGNRIHTLYFQDIKTKKQISKPIKNITPNFVFANDNQHVFYTDQDKTTLRSNKIFRYDLNTSKSELIYEEKDETYWVYLSKTLDEKYIQIFSGSTLSSESRLLDANQPLSQPTVFWKREPEHLYTVHPSENGFFILTNKGAKNYRVVFTNTLGGALENAKEIIRHSSTKYINEIAVFKNHLVTDTKENSLTHIRVYDHKGSQLFEVPFKDTAYFTSLGINAEFDTESLRYHYQSMRMPDSTLEINLKTQQITTKKIEEVPTYNPDLYTTERIWVKARDGEKIPVTILYKNDFKKDSTRPALVYGYGAYGAQMDAWFNSKAISLVDRGFIYALTHVRGGSELGRAWYDSGRTLNKINTFNDFIDITKYLIKENYAHPQKIFAEGGSAGGLLMGAITNMAPELYCGIIAQVPFVDALTTMLDDSIPLTTSEYDEWGNPNEKKYYDYIKSYSPYDNVADKKYPNIFAITGINDSQVAYWEPTKWVQKLREHNKANSIIIQKTNMDAGHGGASGRFEGVKEDARDYAFILGLNNCESRNKN